MDLTPYTNEDAAELLRNVTGLVEAPSNCDGLRVCLNHAVRHALELAADECDAMDAHHAGGALLATAKRMTPNTEAQAPARQGRSHGAPS